MFQNQTKKFQFNLGDEDAARLIELVDQEMNRRYGNHENIARSFGLAPHMPEVVRDTAEFQSDIGTRIASMQKAKIPLDAIAKSVVDVLVEHLTQAQKKQQEKLRLEVIEFLQFDVLCKLYEQHVSATLPEEKEVSQGVANHFKISAEELQAVWTALQQTVEAHAKQVDYKKGEINETSLERAVNKLTPVVVAKLESAQKAAMERQAKARAEAEAAPMQGAQPKHKKREMSHEEREKKINAGIVKEMKTRHGQNFEFDEHILSFGEFAAEHIAQMNNIEKSRTLTWKDVIKTGADALELLLGMEPQPQQPQASLGVVQKTPLSRR